MDCKKAQKMVIPYIRRELRDRELEEFISHIRECKECYEELEIYFTIHFALQKLDEEKDVSYNIQKMLQDDLRLSERRVYRRKLVRIWSWGLMALAELILIIVLVTQYQAGTVEDVRKTPLFELFYGEPETERETQKLPKETGKEACEEAAKKRKKEATEPREIPETRAQTDPSQGQSDESAPQENEG